MKENAPYISNTVSVLYAVCMLQYLNVCNGKNI